MAEKTKKPSEKKDVSRGSLKDFLQRHAAAIMTGLAGLGVLASVSLGVLLYSAVQEQRETLKQIERPLDPATLPGRNYQLSERSKYQLTTILGETPHVVAGFAIKYKYGKHENPIIFTFSRPDARADITAIVNRVEANQASEKGMSSDEQKALVDANPELKARQLRYSEEARQGLIKCIPLDDQSIDTNPELKKFSKGLCYATIPPFDANSFMALIVLIDVEPDESTAEVTELRRVLLQLQIDIFNRDFQGRETWPRP